MCYKTCVFFFFLIRIMKPHLRTEILTASTLSGQVNVVTQRGFVPVDERMQVIDANGNLVNYDFPYKFSFFFSFVLPNIMGVDFSNTKFSIVI